MDSKETYSSGLFGTLPSAARDDDGDEPVGLISAKQLPLTGFTMESCMQNFHNKGLCPQPSPPVAMSLRTRESWALALKDIFDQQINNSASNSSKEQRQQMAGFQGMRNQSMPDLRKRIPELDLSFKRAQDITLPRAQLGFGSPITTPTNQSSQLQTTLPMQHNYLPHPAANFTRLNPSSRQQATAQMTIFYSGNVNVYDDVPTDKAQAIMLLAGNAGSSSFKCPAPPSPVQASPLEMTTMREGVPTPVKATPSQHASVTSSNDKGGGIAKSFGSPTSVAASLASPPPSPAPPADGAKLSHAGAVAKRPHAGIELPHARKASLARFLEKRKDRVQVQQQDQQEGAASEKGEPMSCNDKPDHAAASSGSKKRSRSRSPSPTRSNSKEMNNTHHNKATNKTPSVNEHRFFH